MDELGRVTIHDVARLANVSIATVSRALSGARPVSAEVATRVRAAATRLGYQVDPVGQSLRRQETLTVGLVVADITNPFFPALVKTFEEALLEVGYGLLLADASDDPVREAESVRRLLARRVDALFLTPCHRQRSRDIIAEAGRQVAMVQIDRFASAKAHYVGMDHEGAVANVLGHLQRGGRRHFAFVGSDPSMSTTWERQRAFVRLAAEIDPGAAERVLVGSFTFAWGREAAAEIMHRWPEVDAIVCANDLIALGVIEELASRGLSVPDQVAVSGFDDTMLATLKDPRVTSVRQPLEDMAREAISLIPARAGNVGDAPVRRLLPGTVIPRESTGG